MKKLLVILFLYTFTSFGINTVFSQDKYKIENLNVNTKYSDFGTSFYGPSKVVFASSRKDDNKSRRDWDNGQPFLELYKGDVDEKTGEILRSEPFSDYLASKYHESNAIFTKDLRTVYFTRSNYYDNKTGKDSVGWNNLKIYKADVSENGEFSNITPMPFNNDNYSVGHPALSVDEKTLYFTSDMPGSLGETDIFSASIDGGDSYGSPMNLGDKINTKGKEMFPFVSGKGNLYFSSDSRWGGQGGLDIYVIPLGNSNHEAKNIGAPINSRLDDFAFIIDNEKRTGYFSSNRSQGHGDDDIYYFEEIIEPKFECKQDITGVVRDKKTASLLPNSTVTLFKGEEKITSVIVGSDGKFIFPNMMCDTKYRVSGNKDMYTSTSEMIETTQENAISLDLSLDLTPKEKEIVAVQIVDHCQYALDDINTIYFDLDKYYIRDDAALELDKVISVMQRCPNIVVVAGSHTDSRASHNYNNRLSQNRAQSTVDYIVSRGIDAHRISPIGYGETQLVNHCADGVKCSEAEHQVNRRTEFVIQR